MTEPRWYRSLYWRIAIGFVALLATLLVVQGSVFLWMTGRMTDLFPSRSPEQFAAALASDVGAVLEDQPDTDLVTYIRDRYSTQSSRGFVVVLADGITINSQRVEPPPMLGRMARERLFWMRGEQRRGSRGFDGGGRGGGDGDFDPDRRDWRGRGGFRGQQNQFAFSPISTTEGIVGMAAVPLQPPPLSVALRDLGPILAAVAFGLLVTGTAVGALAIFRPVRRRLTGLREAAIAIGAGETGVRAEESGGDEVAALAHSFNDMALQLEQRTSALEASDRTRRKLLADVSHELMTPLAAIRGYVETLRMTDMPLDDMTRSRYLSIVNDETERLEAIVGDLLDLARLEGGGSPLRTQSVPIATLLERLRHRHQPALDEQRIVLVTNQDPHVTDVAGDQNRIEQALQNIVANAVRHTPEGGTITVDVGRSDDAVVFTVRDTGPGIPEEHLSRIFDRFYKADEARSGADAGSGLGLAIVRAIIGRHGGSVTASNVPEGGARFEVRLPLRPHNTSESR